MSEQDACIQDSQGFIADRTREHLGPTDLGIVRFRRLMLDLAKSLASGQEPDAAKKPDSLRSRATHSSSLLRRARAQPLEHAALRVDVARIGLEFLRPAAPPRRARGAAPPRARARRARPALFSPPACAAWPPAAAGRRARETAPARRVQAASSSPCSAARLSCVSSAAGVLAACARSSASCSRTPTDLLRGTAFLASASL